jgi:hypothetical protein
MYLRVIKEGLKRIIKVGGLHRSTEWEFYDSVEVATEASTQPPCQHAGFMRYEPMTDSNGLVFPHAVWLVRYVTKVGNVWLCLRCLKDTLQAIRREGFND